MLYDHYTCILKVSYNAKAIYIFVRNCLENNVNFNTIYGWNLKCEKTTGQTPAIPKF